MTADNHRLKLDGWRRRLGGARSAAGSESIPNEDSEEHH